MPASGRIVEWANEEILVYTPLTNQHQDIVRYLVFLIEGFINSVGSDRLRFAPFEIKLWPEGPSREPGILFVKTGNQAQLKEKRFEGAPDLVVEIVSPSSVR